MADGVEFSLTGVDELVATLREVTYETKRKGGRTALRKAAQLIRDKAKANWLRVDDEETARSIAANVAERWNGRLNKQTGDLGFRVGVLHGSVIRERGNPDKGTNGPTPHWRLLEFGTQKMRAQPAMRPALENNIGEAITVFATEYEKSLARAIRRANRQGRRA
ncbi:HK97-gp10 family putative phage morphogenesis protein [Pseudomonas abyssi]|uniref:HK97 gp10 family phage protein n=1 Tax=Pseudomonas abyssi TaxID=170540 RepID=A0A395RAK2_9PSED|nr:HK97-gp10 family putative phage morphogenesis protein [Halopseudomonas gallaeciensis]RGP57073.1 hypothetical protein ASB58_07005 [Halopseudomonas gallaeciensis]